MNFTLMTIGILGSLVGTLIGILSERHIYKIKVICVRKSGFTKRIKLLVAKESFFILE